MGSGMTHGNMKSRLRQGEINQALETRQVVLQA